MLLMNNFSMLRFQLPRLCRSFYPLSSNLDKQIMSFLSTHVLDFNTLISTHAYVITTGHANNCFIAAKLIAHYASFNQPHYSTKVFGSLIIRDPFVWNSIIKAHFSNGNSAEALEFFSRMCVSGTFPDQFTMPMVVSACADVGWLLYGMSVHGLALKFNLFQGNPAVGSSFVFMYSKCGSTGDAYVVFDEISVKDVVAWTALVIGYVQNGESEKGLECLVEMHRVGGDNERPNFRTLEGGFQACANMGALEEGRCLHGLALKSGIVSSNVVQSSILSMYSKCGTVQDAHISFCEVVDKDLLSWTSIINAYSKLGLSYESFNLFSMMQAEGLYPDSMVLSCLISSFANSMKVSEGKAYHGFLLKRSCEIDRVVYGALLSMYCKFGLLSLAEKLFDKDYQDNNLWNVMIVGYNKAGLDEKSIKLFREMMHLGLAPDLNSMISMVSSCSRLEAFHLGRSLHCHTIKHLMHGNISIMNSLISMYGKSGNLTLARRLFDMTQKDTVTWNSIISCYTQNGHSSEAFDLFDKMVLGGLKPDARTLVILLSACTQVTSLEKGEEIHKYIRECGFESNVPVNTALIDMYAKCGQLKIARDIFDSMEERDAVSWNVIISCYGIHGDGKSAIEIFEQMEQSNTQPNDVTFLAILSACAHAGFVEEGKSIFRKMEDYAVRPSLGHYACMVDILGRSGRLHEAEDFVLSMPIAPDGALWGSLLTACKMHNDTKMGIRIAKHAIETDPENDGYYVIISDLYSSIGMWEEVERLRRIMKAKGVRKAAGWSTV